MENLTQFTWPRATGRGYGWQSLTVRENLIGEALKDVRTLTFPTPTGDAVAEHIEPLAINGALLWRLAETEISEGSIEKFANAFGLLTGNWFGAPKGGGKIYSGDPFQVWEKEIWWARLVVNVWNSIQENDLDKLSQWIKWRPKSGSVRLVWRSGPIADNGVLASPEYLPEILALFEPGDLILPAHIAVARTVNRKLKEHASPQVLWSSDEGRLGLHIRPHNLLGAIWTQFSEIIDQRRSIARCEVCSEWFERPRKDKRHCSDKCRVRAMRLRKEGKK